MFAVLMDTLEAVGIIALSAAITLCFSFLWPFGIKAMLEWTWPSVFLPAEVVD